MNRHTRTASLHFGLWILASAAACGQVVPDGQAEYGIATALTDAAAPRVPDCDAAQVAPRVIVADGPSAVELAEAQIAHLTISDLYKVEVKLSGDTAYREVPVYETDNYAVKVNSDRRVQDSASFASFALQSGAVVAVRVTALKEDVTSFRVRPASYGIVASQPSRKELEFTVDRPRKLSLDINGRLKPLFVFANPPEPARVVAENGGRNIDFAPGKAHTIPFRTPIHSNDVVYIPAGAVVQGTFALDKGATNVRFLGHGILTSGNVKYDEATEAVSHNSTFAGASPFTNGVSHATWDGLTIVNAAGWVFGSVMGWEGERHLSHHNVFHDLKEIHWNPQTDALWFDGDDNKADDCFFFTNDDLTTHGSNNCTISNIVYWQGGNGGHLFMQDNWTSSNGITYDGIEVIGSDQVREMIQIKATQPNSSVRIDNLTFRNVHVEEHPPPVNRYWLNRFIEAYLPVGSSGEHWRFENIELPRQNANEGTINPAGTFSDVRFKNFRFGSTKVTGFGTGYEGASNISANANVEGVVFE